jgi:flagellar M-ring protein FliF
MDFLNKAIAQVSELFRSMTPGARITAGLLLAVVVVSMGYLFRQSAMGPDAYLFGGEPLSDGQLARMELAFGKAGLSDFQREGNRIRVPSGEQAKYLAAVADAGALPPNFNTILEDALGKSSPWETHEAQRERLKIARQQTLSEIVRNMDWVENAIVLYDDHESRGANQLGSTKQITASVSVKAKVGETLTALRVKNIQTLVAHAVNMKSSDVAITSLDGGGPAGSEGTGAISLIEDEYLKTKIAYEGQKRDSILGALRDIPGVRVEVNADFDSTVEETTDNVKPGEKPTVRRESETEETSTQTNAGTGGQPGFTASGPTRQGVTAPPQENKNETKHKNSDTENVVGVDRNRTVKKGYVPREVWATVSVPGAYIKNIWTAQNPTSTAAAKPEDLTKVQTNVVHNVEEIVDPLLYLQGTKAGNTYKHVRVVVMDSLPVPTIETPSMTTKAFAWTGRYWSTIAMLGVAMFSLVVLRSVVNGKSDGPKTNAAAAPSSPLTLQTDEPKKDANAADDAPDPNRPRLRLKKGKSLKDDLVEIVRDDPNAAADILRSWIAKAG